MAELKPLISILIPTYNRAHLVSGSLETLLKCKVPEGLTYEVLVIDNASTDETQKVVKDFIEKNRLANFFYLKEETPGTSRALNTGLKSARADLIAFLDDDVLLEEDWFLVAAEKFQNPEIAIITGKVTPRYEVPLPDWYEEDWYDGMFGGAFLKRWAKIKQSSPQSPPGEEKIFPIGCNCAFRKVVFEKVGMLDPEFPWGYDEEFGYRAIKAGYTVYYCPELLVYHRATADKVTKERCRRWFFLLGELKARILLPSPRFRLAKVPLWAIKEAAGHWLKALLYNLLGKKKQAFRQEVLFRYSRGIISGFKKRK